LNMTRHVTYSLFALLACGPALGVIPPATVRAQTSEAPFEVAELFLELNDTDGDLGIHGAVDGGAWLSLTIKNPADTRLLDLISRGALRRQGMTQLAFESAEPSFDELSPAVFFHRFPEGLYDIEGIAQDGQHLESTVRLSHVLPAPPDNITLSGLPAAEDCDAQPLPTPSKPVVIDWDPVTTSHPEIGKKGPVKVVLYQLFVEKEGRVKFSVDLPPTVTRFTVPNGVTNLAREFKFEIIARAATGNNTAVESCFRLN